METAQAVGHEFQEVGPIAGADEIDGLLGRAHDLIHILAFHLSRFHLVGLGPLVLIVGRGGALQRSADGVEVVLAHEQHGQLP